MKQRKTGFTEKRRSVDDALEKRLRRAASWLSGAAWAVKCSIDGKRQHRRRLPAEMETAIKTEKDPGRSGFLTEAAPAGCFLFCVLAQTPRKRSFGFCQDVCRRHTPIARPSRRTRRAAAKPAPAAAAAVQTVGMAIERGSFSQSLYNLWQSSLVIMRRDISFFINSSQIPSSDCG